MIFDVIFISENKFMKHPISRIIILFFKLIMFETLIPLFVLKKIIFNKIRQKKYKNSVNIIF